MLIIKGLVYLLWSSEVVGGVPLGSGISEMMGVLSDGVQESGLLAVMVTQVVVQYMAGCHVVVLNAAPLFSLFSHQVLRSGYVIYINLSRKETRNVSNFVYCTTKQSEYKGENSDYICTQTTGRAGLKSPHLISPDNSNLVGFSSLPSLLTKCNS